MYVSQLCLETFCMFVDCSAKQQEACDLTAMLKTISQKLAPPTGRSKAPPFKLNSNSCVQICFWTYLRQNMRQGRYTMSYQLLCDTSIRALWTRQAVMDSCCPRGFSAVIGCLSSRSTNVIPLLYYFTLYAPSGRTHPPLTAHLDLKLFRCWFISHGCDMSAGTQNELWLLPFTWKLSGYTFTEDQPLDQLF